MVVDQLYVRVAFLVGAVGVLFLLRQPLRYTEKPGSRGFVLVLCGMAVWLASEGLTYFVPGRTGTVVLYVIMLFAISTCFVGWILMAFEFATQRLPSRPVRFGLGAFVGIHLLLLVTNYAGVHELIYRSTFTVENAIIAPDRGPLFWAHVATIHALIALSTLLFAWEATRSRDLRRRQAAALAFAPLPGLAANVAWFTGVGPLSYDLTPAGVALGGLILSWALYRTAFLDVAPIARQTVIDEMSDAVVTLDDEDRVVDWNWAAIDLFGATEAFVGMSAGDFFSELSEGKRTTLLSASQTEIQLSTERGGRTRHYLVSVSPIDVGQSEDVGRVVVLRDITPIKRREQQLVEQNEYLDEFAGIVSHDLQGPLMEIRGRADAAVSTGDVTHVDAVLDASDRMSALVENLLELARSGRRIERIEPVSLGDVANAAWQRVWSPDAALDVEEGADEDALLFADPDRLQQLFENLFRNSVEHGTGSEADALTVTVGSLVGGFYVEDDGVGIPAAERAQVFDRGYTTAEDGTGLGLSIVRQIAGAHGWSVRATEGSTGGARFEVTGVEYR